MNLLLLRQQLSRLLICLLILLLFGCSKVYECRPYSDPNCHNWPLETVNFIAYNVDEAEAICVEYGHTFSGPYLGETVVEDTTITFYPQCCACNYLEHSVFGANYIN